MSTPSHALDPVDQLDAALARFAVAKARYEREHGPRFGDEHRRWTGEPLVELQQLSSSGR